MEDIIRPPVKGYKYYKNMTYEEMLDLYLRTNSFRKCAALTGTSHTPWKKELERKYLIEKQHNKLFNYIPSDSKPNSITNDYDWIFRNNRNTAIKEHIKEPLPRGGVSQLDVDPIEDNIYKIGIVSDTHLCSRYQQIESLWKFYERCSDYGITTVLHAGDLVDGMGVYTDQIYEVFLHSEDDQTKYTVKNYPKIDGINTVFISGNHDKSFWKKQGSDICYNVASRRSDMIYKGSYQADLDIGPIRVCLHHGDGGVTQSISNKLQKYVLSKINEKGENAPDALFLGHYHVSAMLFKYYGMLAVQMPCFQLPTPNYMGRKGMNPDIGGIIMDIEILEKDSISMKTEYVGYKPIEDDYS